MPNENIYKRLLTLVDVLRCTNSKMVPGAKVELQVYQIDFKTIIVPDRFQRPYMVLNGTLIQRVLY